jgi:hypothetical protein
MRTRLLVAFGVVAAGAFFLVPTEAHYVARAESDTVEFRTASCGAPLTAFLGADPSLNDAPLSTIGLTNARTACEAAAGKRVASGLALLLGLAILIPFIIRGPTRSRSPEKRPSN